ncbi:putative xyloglucan endotransglucosylase/hydrolase protein 10 [Abeliophyllum distichum]|uniref:Xyloglucan endotransglucosylase/hydrolase n=1 Tax=Abeliophyllum distichum TaxID=126358 RepID=A0ABD1THW1_9LAMI
MKNLSRFTVLIGIFSFSLIQYCSLASVVSTGDFNKDFFVSWSPSHVNTSADGGTRSLKLDKDSGSGFASNDMFLFGQFDMKIKLIPDNSAGAVVAFYLTSGQPNRDEVDFEFLGNVPGQPYILQTNVYVDGYDGREQRIKLWFDPTKDFHTYSVLWNLYQIVFMVDWVPIRTYRNHAEKGVAFPRFQPMSLQISIWDGSDWATNGGKDKIDWSKAPYIASFKNHKIDACIWKGNPRICRANSPTNWWNNERLNSLTWTQRRLFRWVRKYHLIYDYCMDNQRFQNNLPKECLLTKY